ncbi:Plug domain-containing protein [Kamptonema cortianum]|nr:Plug domain-containing protein [Geitlerinema splendidum]MDK3161188.1 Plug domain-containing protein [Kamptonema cortianum]
MLASLSIAAYVTIAVPVRRHNSLDLGQHPIPIQTITGEVLERQATLKVEMIANLKPGVYQDPNPLVIRGLSTDRIPIIDGQNLQLLGPNFDLNSIEVAKLTRDCLHYGTNTNSTALIYQYFTKTLTDETDAVQQETVQIKPNEFFKDGGYNELSFGRSRTERFLTARLVAEYSEGGQNKTAELGSYDFQVGSYLNYSSTPSLSNFTLQGSYDKSFIQRNGGLHMNRDGGNANLLFPQYPLSNIADGLLRPGITFGESTTTVTNYLQSALRTNGTDAFMGALSLSGNSAKGAQGLIDLYAPRGQDINNLIFRPPTDEDECDDELYGPPGLLWIPMTPGYQTMMSGPRFEIRPSFYAGPPANPLIRVLCLNKSLKEPDGNVKYLPFANPDPILNRIATIMDRSDRRGPLDQARAWIYTDQANWMEINERLADPLPPDYFVFALGDVGMLGGVSKAMESDGKLFLPGFLSCSAAPLEQFNYVYKVLETKHGSAVRKWFEEGAPQMAYLVGPQGDAIDREHAIKVLKSCLNSDNADLRMGAMAFLAGATNGNQVLAKKLGDFRRVLYSTNVAEVMRALELAPAFATELPQDALRYLSEGHPQAGVREVAKKLIG